MLSYTEVQLVTVASGVFLIGIDDHGQKHHDFFDTKTEAMAFAMAFVPYHGVKLTEAKASALAPETTPEKLEGYRTDAGSCNCPDWIYRGGSYIDPNGAKVCKHMLAMPEQTPKKELTQEEGETLFACFED